MRIVAACTDLMFKVKLVAAADKTGAELSIVDSPEKFLAEAHRDADLLVVDLMARNFDPDALLRLRGADAKAAAIPLVGFFSHVDVDVKKMAEAAGADAVWPRSKFFVELPELFAGRVVIEKA